MRALVLAAIAALFGGASVSDAAFPGTNGMLLFSQEVEPQYIKLSAPTMSICSLTPGATQARKVVYRRPGDSGTVAFLPVEPAASPDGEMLAFTGPRVGGGIVVATADGLNETQVSASGRSPSWAPDSRRVYYAADGDIVSVGVNGGTPARRTSGAPDEADPDVSPDGRRIVYVVEVEDGNPAGSIAVADLVAGPPQEIMTRLRGTDPSWSPSGDHIAFAAGGSIYAVTPDGSDLRRLTIGTTDRDPDYSPDGLLLAFARDGDIWTIRVDGSDLKNVTNSPIDEEGPTWQRGTPIVPASGPRPCAIVGTEGNDVIAGSIYDDFVYDLGGNDRVESGGGADVIWDGPGNDVLDAGAGADVVHPRGGHNTLALGPGSDFVVFPPEGSLRVDGGPGNDSIQGGAAADRLAGGDGEDVIHGHRGPDILQGGSGRDLLHGDRGDDSLAGGPGNDRLYGGSRSVQTTLPRDYDGYDLLDGGPGGDALFGGWQKDRLLGRAGADHLLGGDHADYLAGGSGRDFLRGLNGDDLLLARDGEQDIVWGGSGTDRAHLDGIDGRRQIERLLG